LWQKLRWYGLTLSTTTEKEADMTTTLHVVRALKFTRVAVGDIPVQQLEMFLLIAEQEGQIAQVDLASICDMPQGTVSRNVARLSNRTTVDTDGQVRPIGHGLIDSRPDGTGRRESLWLTPKGRKLYNDFANILKLGMG